ncbi:helix-turn-helix domain-containing protein [Litorivicinus lipolyticus]|uniref:HTH-type transcriptional repressor AllR n=1 Tax=Litorivicinus lipolyticus TaxID=418701 RepID=A0A5Q2Q6L6_9GAMM|nr:IclR family transcriptional regulator [Litorivicinus lipolyticus]QGG79468.1 helix-turn-helix domain-containing protein [Litorivicinus lipolyticus]
MKNSLGTEPSKRGRGRPKLEGEPSGVKTLDRALSILQTVGQYDGISLSDIAVTMDTSPASIYRFLNTFERRGFVTQSAETGEWRIGIEAFRLGSVFARSAKVVEHARLPMKQLSELTHETANLGILDKGEVVFVAQHETHQPIRAFFRPGSRSAAHSSAIGKAILGASGEVEQFHWLNSYPLERFTDATLTDKDGFKSALRDARRNGFSIDDEERHTGMRCVAAPIFNVHNEVIAGLSVSGPSFRVNDDTMPDLARQVRQTASRISALMGASHAG